MINNGMGQMGGMNNWGGYGYGNPNMIDNNPQTSSMPQLGQPQKSTQLPSIPANIITMPEDIKANHVPMDGSISLFLMNDLSYILAKQWNGDGTIAQVKYVREQVPTSNVDQTTDVYLGAIMERLDKIEGMIKKNRHYNPRPKRPEQKGETE